MCYGVRAGTEGICRSRGLASAQERLQLTPLGPREPSGSRGLSRLPTRRAQGGPGAPGIDLRRLPERVPASCGAENPRNVSCPSPEAGRRRFGCLQARFPWALEGERWRPPSSSPAATATPGVTRVSTCVSVGVSPCVSLRPGFSSYKDTTRRNDVLLA